MEIITPSTGIVQAPAARSALLPDRRPLEPDTRGGRILFAALVALGAGFVHFVLFRPNGLLLSLAFLSPLVPLIDRLRPGERYRWDRVGLRPPAVPAAAQ